MAIAQNPKAFQAIAEHNASSLLLMLPQEIKNRIYYFVCGVHMVHILQIKDDFQHVHGDDTMKLSHAICIERISEEQAQKDFDSADPDSSRRKAPKPNQLSLTLLRSCRQIYLEAKTLHYTSNTFAIFCSNVLERFVRARFQNKQHLAIRSLYLDIRINHVGSINVWSEIINKAVLKCLKLVRCLYLNLIQVYRPYSVVVWSYEGSEMTECQGKMFKKFGKLPLKEAILVIDDSVFLKPTGAYNEWAYYGEMEQQDRWTMKQKQIFSREVRDALLGRGMGFCLETSEGI